MKKQVLKWGCVLVLSLTASCTDNERDAVREKLIDPDSAKFTNVVRDATTGSVCGFVNSKNSFGGYTGRKPFEVDGDGQVEIYDDLGDVEFENCTELQAARLERTRRGIDDALERFKQQ